MNGVPLNIDFQQILLHLFNVVILFFIMYFLLYKPVKNFMDKRRKTYEDMEQEARDKVQEAEDLKAGYEARISQAEEEIRTLKAEASRSMAEKAEESARTAREQADQILEKARIQAENEKNKILSDTSDQITELAKEAAAKVVFDNPSDAFDSFLKAAKE